MQTFHMTDIISALNLPQPTSGRSAYYVQCPLCDGNPKHRHLNINLRKEVFRCAKCGVSGGMFDLYSLYTGTARDKVRQALIEKLDPQINPNLPKVRIESKPAIEECPISDIETRHKTYSALLSKLTLANDHIENLRNRGLSIEDIERLGYKTTPVLGMSTIAKQLENDGYNLAGVPGFFRCSDDSWTFIQEQRGILIPVRDVEGRIQGLQIRRDNAIKRKFRWMSSTERKDGCQSKGWTHIAGPVRPIMLLTEGPMKADIINTLSDASVIAVPGVNSLTYLQSALEILREKGLKEIKTAFDMDFLINWHVQNGYNNLLELLNNMGFRFGTYIWDSRYKGLDDYIYGLSHK